jgi:hypothetical protein
VGAGDIAGCDDSGDEETARLLDSIEGTIFTAGDNAYPDGSPGQFADCYGPSWGRHKARTRPAPGNHDYHTAGAAAYFQYFGANAGEAGKGYYSYELGPWHLIVLNSNCGAIGGCDAGSPQMDWLLADLAAHPAGCTLAYWHHPVVTLGPHLDDEAGILPLWQALHDGGVDIVVNGHEHNYQRYAPLGRDARSTDAAGMRLFVVGTGGRDLTLAEAERVAANAGLEAWADGAGDGRSKEHTGANGVIKFTLGDGTYRWEFVPVEGSEFRDSGEGECH